MSHRLTQLSSAPLMTNWTDSYVTGVAYTHHYFPLLNPVRLKFLLLSQGWQFPEINTACELGFGHGFTINAHVAASTTKWHGTDFLPAHAGLAREMAEA